MTSKTAAWPASKIYKRKLSSLKGYERNSRTHSDEQIEQIMASIQEWGWTTPILVDEDNMIIAGHGRAQAADRLEIETVPVMIAKGWSDAQKRAYVIADNNLALNAGWDKDMLSEEMAALEEMDFELDLLGFDDADMDGLMGDDDEKEEPDAPEYQEQAITALGEIWECGPHRVMCGDGTSETDLLKLLNGADVDCLYTDPPYGISIVSGGGKVGGGGPFGGIKKGKVGGSNIVESSNFAPVLGDGSTDVAIAAIQLIKKINPPVQIIWGGNYYASHLEDSPCWIVWDKQNTGNFADCELAWTNQKTAVRKFEHMWNGMLKASERGVKRVHPTQKPIALAEWCLEQYAGQCETVLDLFTGSGSTLLGCQETGKRGYMMELSPNYIDVIVRRWQDYTGQKAVLAGTDQTFDQIEKERNNKKT